LDEAADVRFHAALAYHFLGEKIYSPDKNASGAKMAFMDFAAGRS
jgi:hypothetical protein